MELHERLPDTIAVDGRRYRVDLDFRNVLKIFGVLQDESLLPDARDYLILKCVMKRPGRNIRAKAAALKKLLFGGGGENSGKKVTDFSQDADLIRAAFLQTYHINLYTDDLHWFAFIGLLSALPEGSRYTEIMSIRARPMPAPTKWNGEERRWLAKMKAEYSLRLSPEEREHQLQRGLHAMTESLLKLAKKGGK